MSDMLVRVVARRSVGALTAKRPVVLSPHQRLKDPSRGAFRSRRTACQARYQNSVSIDTIENISTDFDDDLACTTTPRIEETIRAFAADIERHGHTPWTITIFADDVHFSDGFRSFTGRQKYRHNDWHSQNLYNYHTSVKRMRMVDSEHALVDWSFSGQLGSLPVSGLVTSKLQLNALSGRILRHEDRVQLTCSLQARLAYTWAKFAWAQQMNTEVLRAKVNEVFDFGSKGSGETYVRDYNDPNKFTQVPENNMFTDGIQYALFLTILWTLYQAWASLPGF